MVGDRCLSVITLFSAAWGLPEGFEFLAGFEEHLLLLSLYLVEALFDRQHCGLDELGAASGIFLEQGLFDEVGPLHWAFLMTTFASSRTG